MFELIKNIIEWGKIINHLESKVEKLVELIKRIIPKINSGLNTDSSNEERVLIIEEFQEILEQGKGWKQKNS